MPELLESKEVRGVTLKLIYTVMAGIVVIVASIVMSYSRLTTQISKQEAQNMNDVKYNDLRMRQLETKQLATDIQIAELMRQINDNLNIKNNK